MKLFSLVLAAVAMLGAHDPQYTSDGAMRLPANYREWVFLSSGLAMTYGPAGQIAEQYMNEVNVEALTNQRVALQSHRGGTGEIRFVSIDLTDAAGKVTTTIAPHETLCVRASYRTERPVERPVFQIAIIDVDTGLVVTTATSTRDDVPPCLDGEGVVECSFDQLPLRPRQYVVRLSISDHHQLASYDVVTAGPRFAVTSLGLGVDQLADEDGLVSVPYEFAHHVATTRIPHRV